jgi:hypothetical protein
MKIMIRGIVDTSEYVIDPATGQQTMPVIPNASNSIVNVNPTTGDEMGRIGVPKSYVFPENRLSEDGLTLMTWIMNERTGYNLWLTVADTTTRESIEHKIEGDWWITTISYDGSLIVLSKENTMAVTNARTREVIVEFNAEFDNPDYSVLSKDKTLLVCTGWDKFGIFDIHNKNGLSPTLLADCGSTGRISCVAFMNDMSRIVIVEEHVVRVMKIPKMDEFKQGRIYLDDEEPEFETRTYGQSYNRIVLSPNDEYAACFRELESYVTVFGLSDSSQRTTYTYHNRVIEVKFRDDVIQVITSKSYYETRFEFQVPISRHPSELSSAKFMDVNVLM